MQDSVLKTVSISNALISNNGDSGALLSTNSVAISSVLFIHYNALIPGFIYNALLLGNNVSNDNAQTP
jgi:hypothetical protein